MDDPYFVPTRSSGLLKPTCYQEVVHVDEKRGKKSNGVPNRGQKEEKELDMKQARFEIYKFAQTGLSNTEKQKSQRDLAIKLGAMPPKRTAVNYKKLKEKAKLQKKKEKEKSDLSHLGYVHRPTRSFSNASRNPRAKLNKKMAVGTAILKNFGKVKKTK